MSGDPAAVRKMSAELQATCASLGYTDDRDIYHREPDCLESIKDLIRFIKRDNDSCNIRRQLGSAAILQKDLLPILKQIGAYFIEEQEKNELQQQQQHAEAGEENKRQSKKANRRSRKMEAERVTLETVVRLLVNLSQPARLCFDDRVPDDSIYRQHFLEVESYLQDYKEAFADGAVFSVLSNELGGLLKLDWESREEEDRLLVERILLLVRNVLHIPPDLKREQRTDDDASLHDQILWSMHVSGFIDLLLYLASSDEERHLALHVVEIVSLMLREQTPDQLACCGTVRAASEMERDKKELEELMDLESKKKKMSVLRCGSRHSTFGGTYQLANVKSISDRDLVVHRTPTIKIETSQGSTTVSGRGRDSLTGLNRSGGLDGHAVEETILAGSEARRSSQKYVATFELDFNRGKVEKRRPKNRLPVVDHEPIRRSTIAVRSLLKEFCEQFLVSCYNPLMKAVKDSLVRSKAQENDETYYLKLMTFMMNFNRKCNFKPALISETLSIATFHYVTSQMAKFQELAVDMKKEAVLWSKRMHMALKACQEFLNCLVKMDQSEEAAIREGSRIMKSNIFYTVEYRDLFLMMLKKFNNVKESKTFLKDLLETNHIFTRLLEVYCRENRNLVVQRKKKIIKRKKKKNQKPVETVEDIDSGERAWSSVCDELSEVLQGRGDIPSDVVPFDAISDVDLDQQRIDAIFKIQDCLRSNKPGHAVALFRSAREVWPDRMEFGSADISSEDEFIALREICLTNLPERARSARPESQPSDSSGEEGGYDDDDETGGGDGYRCEEQSFSFDDFVFRYASPLVVKSCVSFLEDFKTNSTSSNHCAVKLLHRIAFDCGLVGLLFQASLFDIFRKLFSDFSCSSAKQFAEFKSFATHVVRKFVEVASVNKKVVVELLFWKSVKDASELTDVLSGETKNSFLARKKAKDTNGWTEDQIEELKILFEELKASDDPPPREEDGRRSEMDVVDKILLRFTDRSKTRRQVLRQLVLLDLIANAAEVKKMKRNENSSNKKWTEEEVEELRNIVTDQMLECQDPMKEIMAAYSSKGRSKGRDAVRKKILKLGLVDDPTRLKRKKRLEGDKKKKKERKRKNSLRDDDNGSSSENDGADGDLNSKSDDDDDDDVDKYESSDDSCGDDDDDNDHNNREEDGGGRNAAERVVAKPKRKSEPWKGFDATKIRTLKVEVEKKGFSTALAWISNKFLSVAKDREEDEDSISIPLVPITEEQENAMAEEAFLSLLRGCGLKEPSNEQEAFWRFPDHLTVGHLRSVAEILSEDPSAERDLEPLFSAGSPKDGDESVTSSLQSKKKINNALNELREKRKSGRKERRTNHHRSLMNDESDDEDTDKQAVNRKTETSSSRKWSSGDDDDDDSDGEKLIINEDHQPSNLENISDVEPDEDRLMGERRVEMTSLNDDSSDDDDDVKEKSYNRPSDALKRVTRVIDSDDDDDDDGDGRNNVTMSDAKSADDMRRASKKRPLAISDDDDDDDGGGGDNEASLLINGSKSNVISDDDDDENFGKVVRKPKRAKLIDSDDDDA